MIKYLSPQKQLGKGNHIYLLPQVQEIAKNYKPDSPLLLTEGEKKAAKTTLEGFPCIGLSGVWNFKDSENDLLVELADLNLRNRKCYICFDSDISHKFQVRHAEIRLAVVIMNRGGIPLSVRLPNGSNQ
jgi:putative DNA primase/helicase